MKRVTFTGLILLSLMLAQTAYASVRINEIAWMGTFVSGTDEWIELSSTEAIPTDLSGWKIEASDGSPSIPLSGTISAGSFFLIERTDDTTVPNISADLIAAFGNGLSNSGETLVLYDATGNAVDTVVGGDAWANIGGDNTTKDTAQRTANSWVTGLPTPKAENVAQAGEVEGASTTGTPTPSATPAPSPSSATPTSKATPSGIYPKTTIMVFAGDDKKGLVGFPVAFNGSSSGLYDESLDRATYRWNFGDGTIGEGKEVAHAYHFAGEYVVTLEVFWSSYHKTDRLSVVVVSPDVVINKIVSGQSGMTELMNRTTREIDLAGWKLESVASKSAFVFSPNSILLAGKSYVVPNVVSHVEDGGQGLRLYLPTGELADEWKGDVMGASVVPSGSTPAPRGKLTFEVPSTPKPLSGITLQSNGNILADGATSATATAAAVLWERRPTDVAVGVGVLGYDLEGGMKWFFALAGLLLIVLAGFIISRSRIDEATAADEYAIIEDIIEGERDLVDKSMR